MLSRRWTFLVILSILLGIICGPTTPTLKTIEYSTTTSSTHKAETSFAGNASPIKRWPTDTCPTKAGPIDEYIGIQLPACVIDKVASLAEARHVVWRAGFQIDPDAYVYSRALWNNRARLRREGGERVLIYDDHHVSDCTPDLRCVVM